MMLWSVKLLSTIIIGMSLLKNATLVQRDLTHNWHPCSQMKDYEAFPPVVIERAQGSWLYRDNGERMLDAMSSWWCKSLGHGHPRLRQALAQQMARFEHVIYANTTYDTIVALSEKLCQLAPQLNKVFYAGDGSCAMEIALKMALHGQQLRGQSQRTQFISLENGYHGETCATLNVSDVGLYRQPYTPLMTDNCHTVNNIPYVSGEADPLWHDCAEYWPAIEAQLVPLAQTTAAIIFEPLVQGAGGMQVYSADFLRRLCHWAKQHDILIIADEIMTGLGRTGRMLACEHAGITPDIVALSKSLTSGWMAFSAVLTTDALYQLFYDDYETGKAFLHSHTFCGNALGAAIALEVMHIITEPGFIESVQQQAHQLGQYMHQLAEQTGRLHNVRQLGMMVAADLQLPSDAGRIGYAIFQEAIKQGAWLRPLGNTLYWLPPLNISDDEMSHLAQVTGSAMSAVLA